jgi:hypothetical protein
MEIKANAAVTANAKGKFKKENCIALFINFFTERFTGAPPWDRARVAAKWAVCR